MLVAPLITPPSGLVSHTMASLLKTQKANAANADAKGKGKRKAEEIMDIDEEEIQAPAPKKLRNKQRVLLLSSRGITHRMRHFMNDLEALLPHVKKGQSVPSPQHTRLINRTQTRSWTRRTTCTSSPSSRTCTTATTHSTSRRGGTRTCISGRRRHRTGRVSRCTSRTCTRWMSSR